MTTKKKPKMRAHQQHHRPRHPKATPPSELPQHPPRLEPHFIVVKARPGGLVYYPSMGGFAGPLSEVDWTAVPISPDIMVAIKDGSVEQQVAEHLPAP